MNENKTVIVFLALSTERIYKQTVFCMLTLFHHLKGNFNNLQIVIYTNTDAFNPYLKSFPISLEFLSKETIASYKGPSNFFFRMKAEIVRDCVTKYKTNVFYLDSDTFFKKNPESLFNKVSPQVAAMHRDEYNMIDAGDEENSTWLRLRKVLRNHYFQVNGKPSAIPFSTRMWNAGLIGISYDHLPLLDKTIQLIDELYSKDELLLMEQFSFSYVLQNNLEIISAEEYVEHYWFTKSLMDHHLNLFFKQNGSEPVSVLAQKAYELTTAVHKLQPPTEPLSNKIVGRLKLVVKAAVKGHL